MEMDRVPVEICSEICAFACMDDGKTGRALSRVSSYIRETSKPYKLQSVSIIGHHQLLAFADLIERIPPPECQVRWLFISAHPRNTASDPKALTPEYARRQQAYLAVARVLRVIASSVRLIHAFFVFYRPFSLLPVSLPHLEELALHGPIETSREDDEEANFQSLKHLHLTSFCSPSYISRMLLKHTSALVDLRFSAPENSLSFIDELTDVLATADVSLPRNLHKLYIHVPTEPKDNFMSMLDTYRSTVTSLQALAAAHPKLVLLPPLRLGMFRTISIQDAEKAWSESTAGKRWW